RRAEASINEAEIEHGLTARSARCLSGPQVEALLWAGVLRQQRAVHHGKHPVADVPPLRPAHLRPQLDWTAGRVRHLEEADRPPRREDVAARRHVVEELREQLVLKVWMPIRNPGGRQLKKTPAPAGERPKKGVFDAEAGRILGIALGHVPGGKAPERPSF